MSDQVPRASQTSRKPKPPAPVLRLDGNAYQEIPGNIHSIQRTNIDTSGLPVANVLNAHAAPLIAQVDAGSQSHFGWTFSWVRSLGSRIWGQHVSITLEEGSVTAIEDDDEAQPQVATVADIHAPLEDNDRNGGTRIYEAAGNYSDVPVANGATSIQTFHDIDVNLLAHLGATPTNQTLPPDVVPRRGETLVGRVIGNIHTGSLGPDGTSKQIFGSPQHASSGTRQGYTVFAPQRSSTSTYTASGRGRTLGGAPDGNDPVKASSRRL